MGIVLETHGALKLATLNWLASQVRVRFFNLLYSPPSILAGLWIPSHPVHSAFALLGRFLQDLLADVCEVTPCFRR
jgi:hypothetical protein